MSTYAAILIISDLNGSLYLSLSPRWIHLEQDPNMEKLKFSYQQLLLVAEGSTVCLVASLPLKGILLTSYPGVSEHPKQSQTTVKPLS